MNKLWAIKTWKESFYHSNACTERHSKTTENLVYVTCSLDLHVNARPFGYSSEVLTVTPRHIG
jgi:hypothetical protein